jgi:hypothetical protein
MVKFADTAQTNQIIENPNAFLAAIRFRSQGALKWVIEVPPPGPADVSTDEVLRAAIQGGAFEFWDDPREDVYNLQDGAPA